MSMPPTKRPRGSSKPVATRLDAKTLARAEALASELGITMAGLLSVSLASYLDRQDTAAVVADIAAAAAEVRDAVALLNARDSDLARRLVALTEVIKGFGSELL